MAVGAEAPPAGSEKPDDVIEIEPGLGSDCCAKAGAAARRASAAARRFMGVPERDLESANADREGRGARGVKRGALVAGRKLKVANCQRGDIRR